MWKLLMAKWQRFLNWFSGGFPEQQVRPSGMISQDRDAAPYHVGHLPEEFASFRI
jgi:hypothetical protein